MLGVVRKDSHSKTKKIILPLGKPCSTYIFKYVCSFGLCIVRQNRAIDRLELEKKHKEQLKWLRRCTSSSTKKAERVGTPVWKNMARSGITEIHKIMKVVDQVYHRIALHQDLQYWTREHIVKIAGNGLKTGGKKYFLIQGWWTSGTCNRREILSMVCKFMDNRSINR